MILKHVTPLIELGASIHWLKAREKAPVENSWSSAPTYSLTQLQEKYRDGYNVGIRLGEPSKTAFGYLHIIDLDVRDSSQADVAWGALLELVPDARNMPSVISGSGGESRHIYFFTENAINSKKLRKSPTFTYVFDKNLGRDVKKNDWEIDLLGTGKQAAIPPSIHPDTGQPYRWERPLDPTLLDLGIVPMVTAERIAEWGVSETSDADEDDLETIVKQMPLELDEAEIERIIAGLPEDWVDDRDTWLQVGAALSHEYQGSETGFERWCEWSKSSDKFNLKDQKTVWKSFKGAKNPVTMRSLIAVSAQTTLIQEHDFLADLIGPAATVAPASTPPATAENVLEWRSLLQYTEDGTGIKSNLPNLQLIIRNDPRTAGVACFNEFTQETVLRGEGKRLKKKERDSKPIKQLDGPIWEISDPVNGVLWGDIHDHALRALLESQKGQGGYNVKVTDRDLKASIETISREQAFHPVREYLAQRVWDGIPRADTMFIDYLGCPDTPYHRAISRLTLLGAVVRVMEPGHKFDFVPILEGLQGKGKSTFISILGHSWSTELTGDFSDTKAMVELMQGSWVIEIPELQGFSKAEITDIKAFVSRTADKVRLAWEKRAKTFPRQCIFIGSTNDKEYLRDSTGARRFWPVTCDLPGQIDNTRFAKEVHQMWAEAYEMYHQLRRERPYGTLPLFLDTPEAAAESLLIQDSRRVETAEDTMAGKIAGWLNAPIGTDSGFDDLDPDSPKLYRTETCIPQIWEECLGKDGLVPHREASLIGKAMTMLTDWERTAGKVSTSDLAAKYGGRVRIYVKKT